MIGVSPALVTVMVTSLALFVSTLLNPSPFMGRFNFILIMYSIATVAIARISIEEGKERAVFFGIILAVEALVAMTSLVQYEETVGGMKFIYSAVVIAITWWSAHQLTWDCTVIEDHDEASNQGLLQKIGLEGRITEGKKATHLNLAETNKDSIADELKINWLEKWKENRKRPHTPGVWVIYYSLAALPLFGLGQLLADAKVSRVCFIYLFGYVCSGLGLLLTTSLLGLRRYLRQRDVEMPHQMAGMWLTVGAVMIMGFMALAFFLPRPGNTRQIADVSSLFDQSQDAYDTSDYAVGSDGKNDGNEGEYSNKKQQDTMPANSNEDSQNRGRQGERAEQKSQNNSQNSENSESDSNQNSQSNENPNKASEKQTTQENGGDNQSSDDSSSPSSEQKDAKKNSNDSQSEQRDDGNQASQNNNSESNDIEENQSQQRTPDNESNGQDQQREAVDDSSSQEKQSNSPSFYLPALPSLGALGIIVQILFWIAVSIVTLYYMIKNHKSLWQALKEIFSSFLHWLSGVFAGTEREPTEEKERAFEQPVPSYPPFSSFQNPFTANTQMPLLELVQYSFNALESLGRELGIERQDDQTPNEFSQAMAQHITSLGQSTLRLGRHYSLAAYAPALLNQNCIQDLKTFWQQLSIVEIRKYHSTIEPGPN